MTIPHWFWEIYGGIVGVGATTTIIVWAVVWFRVDESIRRVPTLRFGQRLAAANPPTGRVCIVVPAHDESRVITALIESLLGETYSEMRVVLVLDRCDDDTASLARAAIAGDARFEIIEIDSCPADWAGKVNAVHVGVTRSRGAADAQYLLFADADTVFSPGCIASSLALMRHRKLDLLSLLSTLTHDRWFERVVQTAAAFELMRQYPLKYANSLVHRRPFANGQFMLFTRDGYETVGGHEAVRNALLEDIALARLVAAKGRAAGVFFADGLFHCRMYADWAQFRRGWKRIYTEAADRSAARLSTSALRIRWLGTLLPLWMFGAGPCGALAYERNPAVGGTLLALWVIAMIVWLASLARIAAVAKAPAWTAPLQFFGAWMTANLLDEAASDLRSRRPTRWGGREYDLGV